MKWIICALAATLVFTITRELLGFEIFVMSCMVYAYAEYRSSKTEWESNTVFIFTYNNDKFEFDSGFDTIKVGESVFFDYYHSGIVDNVRYTIDNKKVTRIVLIKEHEVPYKKNVVKEIIDNK